MLLLMSCLIFTPVLACCDLLMISSLSKDWCKNKGAHHQQITTGKDLCKNKAAHQQQHTRGNFGMV
jgi:hypothetical protein